MGVLPALCGKREIKACLDKGKAAGELNRSSAAYNKSANPSAVQLRLQHTEKANFAVAKGEAIRARSGLHPRLLPGQTNNRLNMIIVVQTQIHVLFNDWQLELDGFQPLTLDWHSS